jgi:chromosome segregation ATPase
MTYPFRSLCLLLLACSAMCQPAVAEEKPGAREREALRRSQVQLQNVQKEQATLQEKLRVADEEREAQQLRLKDLELRERSASGKSRKLQGTLDQAQTDNRTLQTAKAELEQKLARALERAALAERELAQTGAQLKTAQGVLAGRNQQVSACEKRNVELYGLGRKLVAQCADTSPVHVGNFAQQLSGSKRVDFENQLEDYRDQLDGQRLLATDLAQ